ncbi:MAG TPA: phospholipid carrier-dependent glycosyltransferase [Flavipsychrobacter sp.]|nr:phospholipid carrier-dependent glycosyltransferase [Flavipsychrobacter sp.]
MQHASITTTESKYWKVSFYILSAIILVVMPLLSKDYGQSGDEWLQIEYGRDIWNYFFNGDKQALNYDDKSLQYVGQQFYGGFFDFLTEILHQWFPAIPILILRHFFNALMGALMMMFTGLFAYRLSGKWSVGLVALLFIIFSPRIFGESMNNPKDIPLGCGFIMGMYYWLALLQGFPKKAWRYTIGIAIGFGIAFGVRSAGGILQVAYFGVMTLLYFFTNKEFKTLVTAENNKLLKKGVLILAAGLAGGYIIGLLTWPWGLESPISNPIASLKEMTNRSVTLRVFFEGVFRPNNAQPWYYEFKWILISNPLIVIIGVALFLILILEAKKKYGVFVVVFLVFAAFFTPLYMAYKKSSVHDTWRHLFFIYPFWVSMSALGLPLIGNYLKNEKLRFIPVIVAIVGLMPAIIWTFRTHPNQYVYFNELVGGIEGAHGYYDTDYYQNSGLQAGKWILKNAKRTPGKKVLVASNMLGFDKYFAKDTSWIGYYYVRYNDRHTKDWDYYVTYSRYISPEQLQNDKWPPANAVHKIEVDGITLSAVLERKSKAGIVANEALQKQDFATAAQQYAAYVQADPYDENAWANYGIAIASIGQIDPAIGALTKATELDPGNAQFYQILSQLYKAKGDMNGAQQAMNNANAIMMREQEAQQ